MKNYYYAPAVEVVELEVESAVLAASGESVSVDFGE